MKKFLNPSSIAFLPFTGIIPLKGEDSLKNRKVKRII